MFGLCKILIMMVIMNHYIACFWYGLSTLLQDTHSTWTQKAFGDPDAEDAETPAILWAYTSSMHWSLTQFTPASMEIFPRNEYERLFNIVVILMALVVFSSFVSSITTAMTHIRNINAQKTKRETEIRSFFCEHKISPRLTSRVWHYVRQNKAAGMARTKTEDITTLRELPAVLLNDLREE